MRQYAAGMYLKHTPFQLTYLNKYAGKLRDDLLAINLGLAVHQVEYYRKSILGIKNNAPQQNISLGYCKETVSTELDALLRFHATYKGCMMDSLEHRIKELSLKARL